MFAMPGGGTQKRVMGLLYCAKNFCQKSLPELERYWFFMHVSTSTGGVFVQETQDRGPPWGAQVQ